MRKRAKRDTEPDIKPTVESDPLADKRRERQEKRLSDLESSAEILEERADYAEKEAELQKRIADARQRIRATLPPSVFDGLFPRMASLLPKSTGVRAILVMMSLVMLILLLAKIIGSGG